MLTAIRIRTTHDVNGNPRRGWIVFDDRREIGFVDGGCVDNLVRQLNLNNWSQVKVLADLSVTVTEYNARKRGPQCLRTTDDVTHDPYNPGASRFTSDSAGLWLDGARGWRVSGMVVRMAWECGMLRSDQDETIVSAYMEAEPTVTIGSGRNRQKIDVTGDVIDQGGLAELAEAWLNTHLAPAGYWFGPHPDGDGWGLWEIEDE